MEKFISRNNKFKTKLNNHLQKLTGQKADFYTALKNEDILELKAVLSDINNLLTYKLTLIAGEWIGSYFKLHQTEINHILEEIDANEPNSQGYDIVYINEFIKVIAEVKCNIPVKNGSKFGSMQSKHLIEDAQKLLNGKRQISDTSEYLKFLFIVKIGERTDNAINKLLQKTTIRVENEERLSRNITREQIMLLKNEEYHELEKDKVYIKTLALD
ncbi:hypothetical protein [Flavobacterium cerinum]|uniref:Restriction endonuclease n=1 Tax=Flavobacterium cerinum TaxID=2502784 RepID=A0ABY5IQV8_9FLAO|nr:hypothetical protein [Flavobacterium cerinum]UUC45144.1 hypothetical protein NOX80_16155 [Flavobacterium cerinum]